MYATQRLPGYSVRVKVRFSYFQDTLRPHQRFASGHLTSGDSVAISTPACCEGINGQSYLVSSTQFEFETIQEKGKSFTILQGTSVVSVCILIIDCTQRKLNFFSRLLRIREQFMWLKTLSRFRIYLGHRIWQNPITNDWPTA